MNELEELVKTQQVVINQFRKYSDEHKIEAEILRTKITKIKKFCDDYPNHIETMTIKEILDGK